LPPVANSPEATAFLHEKALNQFLQEVRKERVEEVERVAEHVQLSLTEMIAGEDEKVGVLTEEKERGVSGAEGRLAQAEARLHELMMRRERRRTELARQKELTLQGVERMTTILILPHPDRNEPGLGSLRYDPIVEATAMEVATKHEEAAGRKVDDVHELNKGYDITGLDAKSGELRLIEVKGLSASDGDVILTPNEHRVANERRDCYWLYVVTDCGTPSPRLHTIRDPAATPWQSVKKVEHFTAPLSRLDREAR
jgi:hypothetical protein